MRVLLFALISFLFLSPALPVQAQDVFESDEIDEEDALDELERTLGLDGHTDQVLDDMDTTDLINRFYKFCVKKQDPALTEFRQELICGCTSASMKETMTHDELREMFKDTQEGGFQRSRVMAFSKIPCMKQPIEDTLYEACVTNPNITGALNQPKAVCECIAAEMSDFAMGKGAGILAGAGRGGIASPDALLKSTVAEFMGSQTYEWKSKNFTTLCIYKHEYGL